MSAPRDEGPSSPTIRLQELLGRMVVDEAGRRLGRVVDCLAEPWGKELRVTTLLVGPSAWPARYGPRYGGGGRRVLWGDIVALSPHITVRGAVTKG